MGTLTAAPTSTDMVCKFIRSVEQLKADPLYDDGDAAIVRSWMNGRTSAAEIGRTLRGLGYPVSNTRIKEHRLHDCNCRVDA